MPVGQGKAYLLAHDVAPTVPPGAFVPGGQFTHTLPGPGIFPEGQGLHTPAEEGS